MWLKISSYFHLALGYQNFQQICATKFIKILSGHKRFSSSHLHIHQQHHRPTAFTFKPIRKNHNWKRHMEYHKARRKITPKLLYFHNPWTFLVTRLNLLRYKFFWDRDFCHSEFIRGAKQAAVVITDTVRKQNTEDIQKFTTPMGFKQITEDMLLSRDDKRLQLVRFKTEHLRRAIPMKVVTRWKFGRQYCFIDMLFVGLRNTKDFDTIEEIVEINQILDIIDSDFKMTQQTSSVSVSHRIVFAEIFIRFRKNCSEIRNGYEYSQRQGHLHDANDWSVGFYKILSFDVLNYMPRD